jgi:hypothetical protein
MQLPWYSAVDKAQRPLEQIEPNPKMREFHSRKKADGTGELQRVRKRTGGLRQQRAAAAEMGGPEARPPRLLSSSGSTAHTRQVILSVPSNIAGMVAVQLVCPPVVRLAATAFSGSIEPDRAGGADLRTRWTGVALGGVPEVAGAEASITVVGGDRDRVHGGDLFGRPENSFGRT